MRLDDSIALPGGLFHFRVVVGVRLVEPVVLEAGADEPEEDMVGYYRTYGVTAASASAAVALVEALFTAAGAAERDDPPGTVEEIDLAVLDPVSMELPARLEDLAAVGIHFESGRAFFSADEDEPAPSVQ